MKITARRVVASAETQDIFSALLESVSEAVFIIEPSTGRLWEANQQAANKLGYSLTELLALKADHIFSPGTAFLQHLTTASRASSLSGVQLVTKHGDCISSVLTTQAVAYNKQTAMLVIAYDPAPT